MKAFSLVEVLVVTAIIAILAAILFPVVSRTKESGHITACASNLHQISTAELEYGADNDGNFDAKEWGDFSSHGYAAGYFIAIWPYCPDEAKLICPDDPVAGTVIGRLGGPNGPPFINYTGYAINGCLPLEGQIVNPSRMVFFADIAEVRSVVPPPPGYTAPNNGLVGPPGYLNGPDIAAQLNSAYQVVGQWGALRHFGKGNYAMADGHVKLLAASQIAYYSNFSCQPSAKADLVNSSGLVNFPNLP